MTAEKNSTERVSFHISEDEPPRSGVANVVSKHYTDDPCPHCNKDMDDIAERGVTEARRQRRQQRHSEQQDAASEKFMNFYSATYDRAVRFNRFSYPTVDVEGVTNEAYTRLWMQWNKRFQSFSHEELFYYLLKIIRNSAIDELRNQNRTPISLDGVDSEARDNFFVDQSPDNGYENAIAEHTKNRLMYGLTTREREIMERVAAGMTSAEIASELGLTRSSVSSMTSRLRKRMRTLYPEGRNRR